MPGLGHAFLGLYRRGSFFAIAIIAALLVVNFSTFLWPAWGRAVLPIILLAFTASVAIILWALIDIWRVGRRAAATRLARPKRYLVYLLFIVVWLAPNALGFVTPAWRGFMASSASMLPNLQPGDYFFVFTGYFDTHEPQRGDLVVFKLPCQYPLLDRATAKAFEAHCDGSIDFIKRIVGVPGDKIRMNDGILNVNREAAKRERLQPYSFFDEGRTYTYTEYLETLPNGYRGNILEIDDKKSLDNTDEFTVPPDAFS
jgi:signal peptidase I